MCTNIVSHTKTLSATLLYLNAFWFVCTSSLFFERYYLLTVEVIFEFKFPYKLSKTQREQLGIFKDGKKNENNKIESVKQNAMHVKNRKDLLYYSKSYFKWKSI